MWVVHQLATIGDGVVFDELDSSMTQGEKRDGGTGSKISECRARTWLCGGPPRQAAICDGEPATTTRRLLIATKIGESRSRSLFRRDTGESRFEMRIEDINKQS